MVFESVAVELVNYILGDYVENLDTSQLKLGIWGGDINLKNLDIKQSAIDDLDLPFRVAYGHIEKLTLKIPWQSLYSATYTANVEGIYMVVVPKSGVKYDAEKEQKLQREAKQRELARIELVKQQEAERGEFSPVSPSTSVVTRLDGDAQTSQREEKQDTFVEKLTAQIIKNLQIRIRNIHIRYEDSFTVPGRPFSFGITLYNLSFDTTNEQWEPCVLDVPPGSCTSDDSAGRRARLAPRRTELAEKSRSAERDRREERARQPGGEAPDRRSTDFSTESSSLLNEDGWSNEQAGHGRRR
ncbi:hypothetical protein HPB48_007122 [Haemaphysalis longicornis]|uniref:Chorein N-terminal domain-containing protein n=1 Tax=Haemaphysalis longicornis TaxID=44386 RepID=A0A9J6G261_HAELO|nr:hypothetical protein HPB48_007122 [Haemaphysalis longicornis]